MLANVLTMQQQAQERKIDYIISAAACSTAKYHFALVIAICLRASDLFSCVADPFCSLPTGKSD
ncbi:unnamed protein product [Ceratitis capitata]|uniref:(Mediterranean fruit fly) hypothetical protein n=1 Tax=Ceratitis capitata TaxID=7213 RepID=A0A811U6P0_CERCA|nr:unnamed protein product [Ceratitis capitata]